MRILNIRITKFLFLLLIFPIYACAYNAGSESSCPQYRNPTGEDFPIMGWGTFNYEYQNTEINFKNLKDAGFNISLALVGDTALVTKSLKLAEPYGIQILLDCPKITNPALIPEMVTKYKEFSNVMGYYITDEPQASQFQRCKEIRNEIYKYDSIHIPFINLLPIVDPERLQAPSYRDYLLDFINTVKLPMISYDNYPIIKTNGKIRVKENFYENLEIISSVCKEKKIPFWAFCLSAPHFNYPTPTKSDLKFEAFSALAYGAQGLSYYTYAIDYNAPIKYYGAPIDSLGNKTEIWYRCRDVNKEIQSLSKVFLGAELCDVWHTGKKIPQGTKRLQEMPFPFKSLKTENSGVLVSHLKKTDKNYLVIVNHEVTKSQNISLKKESNVKRILPSGQAVSDNSSKFKLEPGGYLIFEW